MFNAIQSALEPAGVQASRIESLWWVMFWVCLAVYVAVLAYLGAALWRAMRARDAHRHQTSDHVLHRSIAIAIGLTVVTLFGLLVGSVVTGRLIASQRDETALVVQVTGFQWWWDVEYQHADPSQRVRTANELHLPLGRTVAIKLLGNDVVHSFWVPALHGKMDIIPGHSSVLWLRPDRPGVYRGQCAEFCGAQHAHMAFTVTVESSDDFERWIQGQRTTAAAPTSDLARRGQQIVQSGPCVMCHQILGTQAAARSAPDLTHIGSRPTLAAGTLTNTREHLLAWLQDPQRIKPGNHMPMLGLTAEELDAVVTYLQGLK